MVEAEYHQSVSIGQYTLIDRQPVARLIDALEHRDGLAGRFADDLLKRQRGPMEQLQRAPDAL